MRNQLDYGTDALDQLNRLLATASDPDEVEKVVDQAELCLRWFDPLTDPDNTTNCGVVSGPGLLPVPHHTALRITVPPLRFYFELDDRAHPFIVTVVRVEWVLALADPNAP